ncbi:MAG: PEP/pyruvate-binding domain-containing protein [Dehalobacterium sp.]
MNNTVKNFKELTSGQQALAGGKGAMLTRMYQAGYPVPEGFVVLPSAFQHGELNNESWNEILASLNAIRKNNKEALFAVRSSALSEDSAAASFAGEFETVLNVETDDAVREAVYAVYRSRESERVKAYSSVQGMEQSHQIAVVIQLMVQSKISGVLFTADPITGSYQSMIGNYVHGLGERLVSGEANAYDFKLTRPKGKYEGPAEFEKFAAKLYQYAAKLEQELGKPQDIEWAVADEKIYLLQSRPITTLSAGNLDTYEINYSLIGDELWTNTNVAEAIPDVYPPFSWSIARFLDDAMNFIPGYYVFSGNICGKPYMNISKRVSAIAVVTGKDARSALKLLGDLYGELPEGMQMPLYPFSRLGVLKVMLPIVIRIAKKSRKAQKNYPKLLEDTPNWCIRMRERIEKAKGKEELLFLWKNELRPYFEEALNVGAVSAIKLVNITSLDKKLTGLVGTEDANTLLSNLRRGSGLASLGPVIGISKVIKGEMSREEYLMQYGHRGPHEYELSIPDPMEDVDWLEKQIEEFKKSAIDVEELLNKQHTKYEAARKRFEEKFPNKVKWLDKQMERAAAAAQIREQGRSEFVRVFRLIRIFALKAGELTGMGEDIFFFYIEEVEKLLSGVTPELKHIPSRKENYERYKEMPPFPSIIRGRFNPVEWAKNPNRRLDYYDATMPPAELLDSQTLNGCAGAAGRIEGTVRILTSPEEGEKLQPGEILVAVTTNIGWTPLFPKAAAIITDIGAPLSHAAIVARELGIPAVVGCTNATTRLKTGDKVLVDGGHGKVQILG